MAESVKEISENGKELSESKEGTPMDVDYPNPIVSNVNKCSSKEGISQDNGDFPVKMPADGSGDGEGAAHPGKSPIAIQRKMKKDDSGISVEQLPEETSDEDDSNTGTVASGKGVGLAKLDVQKTEGVSDKSSPDSGHHEGSFDPDYLGTEEKLKEMIESEMDKQFIHGYITKRLKRSEDSSNDTEEKDDGHNELKESTEKKGTKLTDEKNKNKRIKPPHKWFLCPEVVHRQYGTANRFQNDLFRLRAGGSLHMVERLELMYKMERHDGCVNSLHFNCSGTRLASGSDDLNIVIWDWTISHPSLVYDSGHRSNIFQAKFIPFSGDCHIVSCARDGQVRLAELSSTGVCKTTRRLAQHRGPAHKLALEYDSPQTFLSCGEDALVYEIDLRESKPEKLLTCKDQDHKVALYTVFVNPGNGNEFAIGGRNHLVRIYDKRRISENGCLKTFCPHHLLYSDIKPNVTCLVYNYNGSEILATYNDEDIYTFDSQHSDGADYTHRYTGHRNNATVKGVNYFGSGSEYIVSGSDCGNIYFWDHDSEQVVNFMTGDEGGVVNCLEPHPQLPILATSGLDEDVKIWVPSCEQSPTLAGLRSIMAANKKDREEDRMREPDTIDGQMLWYFMHHLRRTARRRARQEGQEVEETSTDNSDDSEESEDSEDNPQAVQCNPS
uniref:DDB1-and CUL4-associated factor 8 n=1 Tax=Scolopendra viridis TaxID=118503 RepID=A0A4D5RA88_SCOVI